MANRGPAGVAAAVRVPPQCETGSSLRWTPSARGRMSSPTAPPGGAQGSRRSGEPQESIAVCRQSYSAFQLVELDRVAGERSGVIRADLEGRGERIDAYNVLIAVIALARSHVLATHNHEFAPSGSGAFRA
jgi:hypothetical protein